MMLLRILKIYSDEMSALNIFILTTRTADHYLSKSESVPNDVITTYFRVHLQQIVKGVTKTAQ
jgi:hypothetical protein